MSYNKQTFKDGDVLHADDLNKMSEGIVSKQDELISGENIKTINGVNILGSGNINIETNITVDDSLSSESTNPVQNKVVKDELDSIKLNVTNIEENVKNITTNSSDIDNLKEQVGNKQDTLTPGEGITIVDGVISVSYPNGDEEAY